MLGFLEAEESIVETEIDCMALRLCHPHSHTGSILGQAPIQPPLRLLPRVPPAVCTYRRGVRTPLGEHCGGNAGDFA